MKGSYYLEEREGVGGKAVTKEKQQYHTYVQAERSLELYDSTVLQNTSLAKKQINSRK